MKYGIIFLLLSLVLISGEWLLESHFAQVIVGYCAISFLVVGCGYLFKFPLVWLKRGDGTIQPLSFILLLPIHLLNWVSFQLATCSTRYSSRHEIAPNLWLGRKPKANELIEMNKIGPWAVVDMTSEFQEPRLLRGSHYLCIPTLDHTAPTATQIEKALAFIQQEISHRPVLVHCALGHGRSATVVAAWMLRNNVVKTSEEAERKLRETRAGVRLKDSQLELLNEMFNRG